MILLASRSASRAAMLRAAGVAFETVAADVDERALEAEMADSAPDEMAQALAAAKAAVVTATDGRLVLGSESLVVVDEQRFNKPASRDLAADHLRFFSGKTMELHSAAALVRDGRVLWVGHDFARLKVRSLSEPFIQNYLDIEWPEVAHCVGVFRIEGRGVQLFERIAGDYHTILGMPLLQVLGALRQQGELPQ